MDGGGSPSGRELVMESLLGRADALAQQQQHLLPPSPGTPAQGNWEAARLLPCCPCRIPTSPGSNRGFFGPLGGWEEQ